MTQHFSRRHGHADPEPLELIREDAPKSLREAIYSMSRDYVGSHVALLNRIYLLSGQHWRDKQSVSDGVAAGLVRGFLNMCVWFHVYDTIEIIQDLITTEIMQDPDALELMQELINEGRPMNPAVEFAEEVNEYLVVKRIGYQLVDGKIEHRGDEAFEYAFADAVSLAGEAGLLRAQSESREAREALSRRPNSDPTGAISRSTNALESVARSVTSESEENWGKIVRKHPDLLPELMMEAVRSIREYAQENARHIREDRIPRVEDAEMAVHASAAVATYLIRKNKLVNDDSHDLSDIF